MFVELLFNFGSVTVFLVTFAISLALWRSVSRPPGIPPGPPLLPLIGNLYLRFWKEGKFLYPILRKKYGDIFSVYYGRVLFVVLTTGDLVREAYIDNAEDMSDKPMLPSRTHNGSPIGIVAASGTIWKQQRKFAMATLRSFGFGKRNIEDRIMGEIRFLLEDFKLKNGQPFDPKTILRSSVSNVITSIVFGKRFEYDDRKMAEVFKLLDSVGSSIYFVLLVVFPFLRHLPVDLFGTQRIQQNLENRRDFLKIMYREHLETYEEGVVRDFVDAYIHKMKQEAEAGNKDCFTELQCLGIMRDLYEAGSETTATAILWLLIHIIREPEIQDRIRAEIDDVVGSAQLPSLHDRRKMPFTQATIMEVLRLENVVPFAVPHQLKSDVMFKGHYIPKSASIYPNLDSVLKDPGIWTDPEDFRPSRFIDKDGNLIKKEEFIPFSLGRRVCLGESMALSTLFLFVTSLVQKFVLSPPVGEEMPGLDCMYGEFIHRPLPYKLRAVPRNQ
ncbi:hypothetical protein ScPMuIL_015335 [Solemya velum]